MYKLTKEDKIYLEDKGLQFKRWYRDRLSLMWLRKNKGLPYNAKSVVDPGWRFAHDMLMPKRAIWYQKHISRLEKKVDFMLYMKSATKDQGGMQRKISLLVSKRNRFRNAYDLCMSKVLKNIKGTEVDNEVPF